jgi:hypothetical protein
MLLVTWVGHHPHISHGLPFTAAAYSPDGDDLVMGVVDAPHKAPALEIPSAACSPRPAAQLYFSFIYYF